MNFPVRNAFFGLLEPFSSANRFVVAGRPAGMSNTIGYLWQPVGVQPHWSSLTAITVVDATNLANFARLAGQPIKVVDLFSDEHFLVFALVSHMFLVS